MKKFVLVDGKRHAVWFHEGYVEFAGSAAPQPIPEHGQCYAYTHGGRVYQAACELAWRLGLKPASHYV